MNTDIFHMSTTGREGSPLYIHSGQNRQKIQSERVVFVNSALKIQYRIVKNTLLQTDFSAILPTGESQCNKGSRNLESWQHSNRA